MLGGRLRSGRDRCILAVVGATQGRRQRTAEGPPEHRAGENIDHWIQGRVQKVQPQRHNIELGQGVEGCTVLWPIRANRPHSDSRDCCGQKANDKHCHDGSTHLHCLPYLVRIPHLSLLQESGDPDGAEQQHSHWDDELHHGQDAVHTHENDDGSRRLFVGREEEALRGVATALDVAVGQHGNARTSHQHPDHHRHQGRLPLGHAIEFVMRMDHLQRKIRHKVCKVLERTFYPGIHVLDPQKVTHHH